MKSLAQAPSNIALIKYMGKSDADQNIPANASLSYTLDNLLSFVEIEQTPQAADSWEALDLPGAGSFQLSENGKQRFLDHFAFLKQRFNFNQNFIIRSCNNFPSDCGLASSASSFAALTRCAYRHHLEINPDDELSPLELANLSRRGSGSSCRSFFDAWALWDEDTVSAIELPYDDLIHQVILVSHGVKAISSREAHGRVLSSPHYEGRTERAQTRLHALIQHLSEQQWADAHHVVWEEFKDMHQLFESAEQPFQFITDRSNDALKLLSDYWEKHGDGPLVTMDAGPNIHLLYRADQKEDLTKIRHDILGEFDVL